MDVAQLLIEAYDRVPDLIAGATADLTAEDLRWAPAEGANPIGWLIWHLTRVEDHHLAELTGEPQVWVTGDVARGFGLDPEPDDTGYGHDAARVAAVAPDSVEVLLGYHRLVHDRVIGYVRDRTAADLDDVVDRRWDPPVTRGVRLVSMVDDAVQHAGQAAYVRGLLLGRR